MGGTKLAAMIGIMDETSIRLACVIVHYRYLDITLETLGFLRDGKAEKFTWVIVDNSDIPGDKERFEAFAKAYHLDFIILSPGENLGFAEGVNHAWRWLEHNHYSHAAVVNSDAHVQKDFGEKLIQAIRETPGVVLAGCVLDPKSGSPGNNIARISNCGLILHPINLREVNGPIDFVSGCFFVLPLYMLSQVGYFEGRYFMYREDYEFCLRLRKRGFSIRYCPELILWHQESSSTDRSQTPKEFYRIRNQTHAVLKHGNSTQVVFYLVYLAVLLVYKLRHPKIFQQFLKGFIHGLRGRLGPHYG